MKKDIKREDIKYNFLKNIVIRFDFDGMDEAELDLVLSEISPELKKSGYITRTKEIFKEMDLKSDDPENIEIEGLSVKNVRQQRVFVFHHQDPQVKLKLSSSFAFISINKTKYVNCLDYCDTLLYVIKVIAEKVPYFNCKRFGLRKINQCFLMDINKLNEYFEKSHYHIYSFGDKSNPKVTQLRDSLFIEKYNVNLVRTIICGEIEGNIAYQINLDSDIYLLGNEAVMPLIQNKTLVSDMNDILFDLYKDAITESFIKQLIEGAFNKEIIRGVTKND